MRGPYCTPNAGHQVIVKLRVIFQVSWANRLQLEKLRSVSGVLETMNASGTLLARTFDKERKPYCA